MRIRGGVSVTPFHADTEGPQAGPPCWVVAEAVLARRERGRASPERPLTRRAKQKPHAVKTRKGRPPTGQEEVQGVATERAIAPGWEGKRSAPEWREDSAVWAFAR